MKKILVIDDDFLIRDFISNVLVRKKYDVVTAKSGEEGLKYLEKKSFDLVLSDIKLPGISGIDVLRYVKENDIDVIFLLMTAYADIETAVESMKLGASNYLKKPFSPEEIELVIEKELEIKKIKDENASLKERYLMKKIIAQNEKMKKLLEIAENVAKSRATVLIRGESGTGKEVFANIIRDLSDRKNAPFIKVNCAAIPENLLESELFGYEKGTFTGADKRKDGKFVLANKGTILLDEIGDIPVSLQAKLLRVLQEREVDPLGSRAPVPIDVRVIATTNSNLEKKIEEGEFREDLYFRLNVIPVFIPPLRERKDDIPLLAHYFLEKFAKENGLGYVPKLSNEALDTLYSYDWPGNVRELENMMERLVVLNPGKTIGTESILFETMLTKKRKDVFSPRPLKEVEKDVILKTFEYFNKDKKKTAEALGISIKTLSYKLKEYEKNI